MKSFAALVAAFLVASAISALTYRSMRARAEAASAVNRATTVRNALNQMQLLLEQSNSGQRGYVLTGDRNELVWPELARDTIPSHLAQARAMLANDEEQLRRLDLVEPLTKARLTETDEVIRLRRDGNTQAAVERIQDGRGKAVADEIRSLVTELLDTVQARVDRDTAAWEESVRWSSYVMFGGTGVLVTMLFLVGLLASRDFRAVETEGWIRRLQLAIGSELQSDVRLEALGEKALDVIVPNLGAQVAAVYVSEPAGLRRIAAYAMDSDENLHLNAGQGLAGQAAIERRVIHLTDVPNSYLKISSATGSGQPREVAIVPAVVDGKVQAVIELGFLRHVDGAALGALERMSDIIASAVRASRDRTQLEELLEETQRQAEELQSQQEELRVTNEELEQQTRALQISQTQLENQQSELEQINAQLEEQTSSLERQRDDLARASSELQRANEYKSQFLANMSHELRTPLNSSLILAKLLASNREGNLSTEQISFANTIYSAGNDLLTLINDILDLSKIEAGMLDVRPEPVVLARTVDDLRNTFGEMAAEKQLTLELELASDAPESIETDPTRMHQILRNLVSNAIKFTEDGGVTIEISTHGDMIKFAVRDTGIGIAPDQHELVFEAFRQADGATTRKFGGTGLGLTISRDLARLLGGDLVLESTPGRGSTFTLTLPRKLANRSVTMSPGPSRTPTNGRPAARPPERAKRPPAAVRAAPFADDRDRVVRGSRCLLVIEDDVAFARVLYDLGHELEFSTVVATTGEDGLTLARELSPSAIVLDIALPDRSGLAVLDSLKRDPRTRHIPVHVVSGHDYTRTALEMGAAGYALKPIEREQLIEALKRLEQRFTQKLRRVLVVEDDPVLRESTARLLSTDDVETKTAGTTAEALELLKTTTFDCLVLDLALPDRSGLELLEEIAHKDQFSFPPVIVYTGRSLSNEQVHELEKFSQSIIIKGARSPERLLDEVTLFLHQIESELPPERQRMLRDARDREAAFEGRRILIVEDDVRNVFALSAVLEPKGAAVAIARNGREAIDYLHKTPEVDLVLMDIMMPEMDGIEATRELRKDPQFAKLPIIALTAKAMIDDREKCLDAGANDYIAKPLDVDKLLSLARVWIRK
ncbi:MAG: response regulator [Kofleriaceae bacterium]